MTTLAMRAAEWLLVPLLLSAVAVLTYYNALPNDFAFDDNLAIVNNKDVQGVHAGGLWRNDIWGKDLQAIDSHRSYRPLLIICFRLIRQHAPEGHSAWAFRIVSVGAHSVASFFVYLLSRQLSRSLPVALAAAVLFCAHPVHVEAVAAVVNMAEALHSIFYISMFLLFRASTSARKPGADALSSLLSLALRLLAWFALLVVAVLFKETGLTVVGIMLAYSALALLRSRDGWLSSHGPWVAACLAGVMLYLGLRMSIAGRSLLRLPSLQTLKSSFYLEESELIRRAENPFAFLNGRQEKVLSFMHLHVRYFLALLLPLHLCAEYAFDCIPKVSTLQDPRNAWSLLLYLAMTATGLRAVGLYLRNGRDRAVRAVRAEREDACPEALLGGFLWMVVPFVPASGLLLRLGTLLAERLLYVPSIGFCLLLALALHAVAHRLAPQRPRLVLALLVLGVVGPYVLKARAQNEVWRDDETLFMQSLKVCPSSAKLQLQVAKLYMNKGDYAMAATHLARSRDIDPGFCDTGYQLALLRLFHERDVKGAMEAAADNLSCVFTNMHSWELLSKLFDQQLAESPNNAALLELQGDMVSRGQMHAFACKKYCSAASAAFEQGQSSHALALCLKAEATVPLFVDDGVTNSTRSVGKGGSKSGGASGVASDGEGALAVRDLVCFVEVLGGSLRASMADPRNSRAGRGLSKRDKAEALRGRPLLLRAMRPECIVVDPISGKIVGGSNALSAAGALQPLVDPRVAIPYGLDAFVRAPEFRDKAASLDEYAAYLSASADLYLHVGNHGGLGEAGPLQLLSRVPESRLLAVYLWVLLGQWHFQAERYADSARCLRNAMQWGVGRDLDTQAGDAWFRRDVVSEGLVKPSLGSVKLLAEMSAGQHARQSAPCFALYWLAHALAAEGRGEGLLTRDVRSCLAAFVTCRDDPDAVAFPVSRAASPALARGAASQLAALEAAAEAVGISLD